MGKKKTFRIRLVENRIPQLKGKARERARLAVRKAAFDINAHAKAVVPVDTGKLKGSIQMEILDEGDRALVGACAHYAPYVEFGTYKMAAKPYLTPAVERVRPSFEAAMRRLLR